MKVYNTLGQTVYLESTISMSGIMVKTLHIENLISGIYTHKLNWEIS